MPTHPLYPLLRLALDFRKTLRKNIESKYMALTTLTKEEFRTYSDQVSSRSFMQSVQMGGLIRKKEGARIVYLALKQEGEIQVAALVL